MEKFQNNFLQDTKAKSPPKYHPDQLASDYKRESVTSIIFLAILLSKLLGARDGMLSDIVKIRVKLMCIHTYHAYKM